MQEPGRTEHDNAARGPGGEARGQDRLPAAPRDLCLVASEQLAYNHPDRREDDALVERQRQRIGICEELRLGRGKWRQSICASM